MLLRKHSKLAVGHSVLLTSVNGFFLHFLHFLLTTAQTTHSCFVSAPHSDTGIYTYARTHARSVVGISPSSSARGLRSENGAALALKRVSAIWVTLDFLQITHSQPNKTNKNYFKKIMFFKACWFERYVASSARSPPYGLSYMHA